MREIENASFHVGSAISDPDETKLSVRQVDDPDHTTEGKGPMGRGQPLHIIDRSVGGLPTMKLSTVPGSNTSIFNTGVKLRIALGNPGTSSDYQTDTEGQA